MIHWELFGRIKVYVQLQEQKVPGHKRLVKAEVAKPNKHWQMKCWCFYGVAHFYGMIYGDKTKIMLI